jgi:hypothetical protein
MKPSFPSSLLALTLLAACHAEGSNTPESSSSSHWIACRVLADCAGAPDAVACTHGYCVDARGERVRASKSEQEGEASTPALERDASSAIDRSEDADVAGDAAADVPLVSDAASTNAEAGAAPTRDGSVSLHALGTFGNPGVGYSAAFHDAEGKLLGEQKTGADGRLATSLPVWLVSVFRPSDGGGGSVTSFVGVAPGDELEFLGTGSNFPESRDVYALTLPPAPASVAFAVHGGREGCPIAAASGPSGLAVPYGPCLRSDGQDALLAWATDARSFASFRGFSWVTGLSAPASGNPALPVTFPALQAALPCQINVRNAEGGSLSELIMWNGDNGVVGPGPMNDIWPYAEGFSKDLEAHVVAGGPEGRRELRRRAAPADHLDFDLANMLPLPQLNPIERLENPPRLRLSWSMPETTGVRPYAALIYLSLGSGSWTLIVRPELRSVTLPVLPDAFGYAFTETALRSAKPLYIEYQASDVVDYRAFVRQRERWYVDGLAPLLTRGYAESVRVGYDEP